MLDCCYFGEVDGKTYEDAQVRDTDLFKARNIVDIQLESYDWIIDMGTDLNLFLKSKISFMNESFHAHIADRLSRAGVVIEDFNATVSRFIDDIEISIGKTTDTETLIEG